MTKTKKIQKMLDNATSIEIDGIELTHWTMDELQDCDNDDNDDIVFRGFAETEDGDYHWSIPAWGFGEIAEAEGNVNIIQAKFRQNLILGNQLGSKYAGQQFYAAEATAKFELQMERLAAQFTAASKTAFFGHGIGSVGYAADSLQLAGVSAETIAQATKAASSAGNGTSKMAADMVLFANRTDLSADSVANIQKTLIFASG